MKIHRWIDKYNYRVSFKIIRRYYEGISNRRPKLYSLYPIFWLDYFSRLVLVFASILSLKKTTFYALAKLTTKRYSAFFSSDDNSQAYIQVREFISTLFGYRNFVENETLNLLDKATILSKQINFNASERPTISIIITGIYRLDYLYNCLYSLKKNLSKQYSFEVILIKCSDSDISKFLNNNISGINIYGDAPLANIIKRAKGNLIYLHSCDSQLKKFCIEYLIESLKKEDIGCVITKHIYKNGLLFRKNKGLTHFEDKNNPEFNYQRHIKQYSSSNLIFSKNDYLALRQDEVDNLSAPNLGIEICRSLNRIDKKTIYQPLSEIICFNHQTPKQAPALIENPDRRTILFIDDFIPMPDQDSGSNRIFKIMQLVKSLGFHILFLPANGIKTSHYFERMTAEGFEVLYRFPNRRGMIKILELKLPFVSAVWLCKPNNNLEFKFLFDERKDLVWIYDTIDLHFLRLQREGKLSGNPLIMQKSKQIRDIELNIAKQADFTLAITNDERKILQNEGIENVVVIPNIHESKINEGEMVPFEQRSGLLFIGGYLHKPNVDAVKWLVKDIMPLVWVFNPSISLILLGSNPTDEITALRSEKIIVPGYIHDVSYYFTNSKIFVSPLRFGAGMKGKIGQSLEFGLPIVSTDIGVEGIGLIDRKDVMVANDAEAFAEKIIELYNSSDLWYKINANTERVLKPYTAKVVKQQIKDLLQNLISREEI